MRDEGVPEHADVHALPGDLRSDGLGDRHEQLLALGRDAGGQREHQTPLLVHRITFPSRYLQGKGSGLVTRRWIEAILFTHSMYIEKWRGIWYRIHFLLDLHVAA